MTLVDAGAILAIFDSDDRLHESCRKAFEHVSKPVTSSWPPITEAMYLLGRDFGWAGQQALWAKIRSGALQVIEHSWADVERMADLMHRYRDVPMDLADASLVALADRLGTRRIFTIDSDFRVYRNAKGKPFDLLP